MWVAVGCLSRHFAVLIDRGSFEDNKGSTYVVDAAIKLVEGSRGKCMTGTKVSPRLFLDCVMVTIYIVVI
jgi:hypothetical protein